MQIHSVPTPHMLQATLTNSDHANHTLWSPLIALWMVAQTLVGTLPHGLGDADTF